MLITLVATNVFFPDEDVRILAAEGGPVLAQLPHGDKVGGAGGETAGGAKQGVAVMFPPMKTLLDIQWQCFHIQLTYVLFLTCSMQRTLESLEPRPGARWDP